MPFLFRIGACNSCCVAGNQTAEKQETWVGRLYYSMRGYRPPTAGAAIARGKHLAAQPAPCSPSTADVVKRRAGAGLGYQSPPTAPLSHAVPPAQKAVSGSSAAAPAWPQTLCAPLPRPALLLAAAQVRQCRQPGLLAAAQGAYSGCHCEKCSLPPALARSLLPFPSWYWALPCSSGANLGAECWHSSLGLWNKPVWFWGFSFPLLKIIKTRGLRFPAFPLQVWIRAGSGSAGTRQRPGGAGARAPCSPPSQQLSTSGGDEERLLVQSSSGHSVRLELTR